ncbi:MAG TPA: rhomboid family intramembrane serine protease, partial [Xanthobacteraceae bacterium]|nr:rhomboid family intramembrane serine protease [Xanthobacteraceae bacterium]
AVAWQAHIGGFLAGLVLFVWFDPVVAVPPDAGEAGGAADGGAGGAADGRASGDTDSGASGATDGGVGGNGGEKPPPMPQ